MKVLIHIPSTGVSTISQEGFNYNRHDYTEDCTTKMNSKRGLLFAWQFKEDSQILGLYRCGLQVRLFKVHLQLKSSDVVA